VKRLLSAVCTAGFSLAAPLAILSCAGRDTPTDSTPHSPPTITTASQPNGTVGEAYSQTLAATGGDGSYSWAVSSGSLPAGLSLSASGAITGTPTTAGTASLVVQVTSAGLSATKSLSITIEAAIPPLTITTSRWARRHRAGLPICGGGLDSASSTPVKGMGPVSWLSAM